LAGCFSDRSTIIDPAEANCSIRLDSPAIGTVGALVAMQDFRFQPQELRVPRGTRVTWVYCEPPGIDPHTTTSDTGLWDAEFTSSVDSFSRVFDQAGRFEYHCIPHASFMRGVVIVE
jgi:plastocyanin